MAQFVQYPYIGTAWDYTAAVNAGVANSDQVGYVGFFGSSANVSNPVCAACDVGGKKYAITVGRGFKVGATGTNTTYSMDTQYLNTDIYHTYYEINSTWLYPYGTYESFASINEACQAFIQQFEVEGYRNIRYTGNGCTVTGPTFVRQGASVTVYVSPNIGANVTASGISVTHNGSPISFQYNAGILTFTAS